MALAPKDDGRCLEQCTRDSKRLTTNQLAGSNKKYVDWLRPQIVYAHEQLAMYEHKEHG